MAEKTAKKKPKKAARAAADPSVLGTLRSTRPSRLGGERRGAATKSSGAATKSSGAATKSSAAAKSGGATSSRATKAKSSGARKPRAAKSAPAATAAKSSAAHRPGTPRTAPPPPRRDGRPGAVTTAVQAAGELAQIGLMVGGRMLKRAARRLPGR